MKNRIIIALSILLLFVTGYALYESFNGDMSKAEVQAQFDDLRTEYESMQKDLQKALIVQGIANEQLVLQKKQIDELMQKKSVSEEELKKAQGLMKSMGKQLASGLKDELKALEAKISELEAQKSDLEAQKTILENQKVICTDQNISLDNQKTILENKNVALATNNNELNQLKIKNAKEIEDLKNRIKILGENKILLDKKITTITKESEKKDEYIEYANKLRLSNFMLSGYKVRSAGKEVAKNKASRIDRIKLYADIDENKISESGPRVLYFIVYKPDGSIATFTNKKSGNFNLDPNTVSPYSDVLEFNYILGTTQKILLIWDAEDFQKGDYKIEVYEPDPNTKQAIRIGKVTKTLN